MLRRLQQAARFGLLIQLVKLFTLHTRPGWYIIAPLVDRHVSPALFGSRRFRGRVKKWRCGGSRWEGGWQPRPCLESLDSGL